MKTVSVIGCGALANVFAKNLPLLEGTVALKGIWSRTSEKVAAASQAYGCKAYGSLEELLADKPDFVAEFAGGDAVRAYAEQVLAAGIDLICISVGAFADKAFLDRLKAVAEKSGAHLYVPNGAIGGLDMLQIHALTGGAELSIENVKAPRSLEGAPYLKGEPLPTDRRVTVFEGSVADAIAGFPKNVNVAVAASIAAANPDARVSIISDPYTKENSHTIRISNGRVRAELSFFSTPNPQNPKSSSSAAVSVIALLKNITGTVRYF